MASPIHQFEIHTLVPLTLGSHDVSFTNSSLFMVLAGASALAFVMFGMQKKALVPGKLQTAVEMVYSGIGNLLGDAAGAHSKPFFPFLFSIFLFILFANLLGMIPGAFTITSHIIVTFLLAITVFLAVTITGFVRHGLHFFSLFVPHGTPPILIPLIFILEMISYCVRPFSLSIRLFANMLAGHIILKVFGGMAGGLVFAAGFLPAFIALPLIFNVAITGFEFFVAALQAFVFAIMSAVYLHDALEMH